MNNSDTARRYHYWRAQGLPASAALSYVRTEQRSAAILARFGEWEHDRGEFHVHADLEDTPAGYTVRAWIAPDEFGLDWGDLEPTEAARAAAEAFVVGIDVLNAAGESVYNDVIGGVDVIDLPGYLQRTWRDAAAYALDAYLLAGAERFVALETTERAHWEARDTITV